jgi:hypothetical protein
MVSVRGFLAGLARPKAEPSSSIWLSSDSVLRDCESASSTKCRARVDVLVDKMVATNLTYMYVMICPVPLQHKAMLGDVRRSGHELLFAACPRPLLHQI